MKFLPFENIKYETLVDSEEILNRIKKNIGIKKALRVNNLFKSKKGRPYEGYINGNTFDITRIIYHKNAFLPRIEGEIEQKNDITEITVRMSLHPVILVFMLIWCGFLLFIFFSILIDDIKKGKFEPAVLIILGMSLFGYLLATLAFKYESKKTKKHLTLLFESETKN